MQRVDDTAFDHQDKVLRWRRDQLLRMFPRMRVDDAELLARNGDPELLAQADRLCKDGCSAELALQILR